MKRKQLKKKRLINIVTYVKMVPDENFHNKVREILHTLKNIEKKECFDAEKLSEVLREFKDTCFPHSFKGVPVDSK